MVVGIRTDFLPILVHKVENYCWRQLYFSGIRTKSNQSNSKTYIIKRKGAYNTRYSTLGQNQIKVTTKKIIKVNADLCKKGAYHTFYS